MHQQATIDCRLMG